MTYKCQCRFETDNYRQAMEHARRSSHNFSVVDNRDQAEHAVDSRLEPEIIRLHNQQEVVEPVAGKLAAAVSRKRGKATLRSCAAQLGIPFTTLVNVEKGHIPGPGLFIRLLVWLGVIDKTLAAKLTRYAK